MATAQSAQDEALQNITVGEGSVITMHGEPVAVYKETETHSITLSPICTHKGCLVEWNASEKTWDCPCHGSRFTKDGKVIQGPAIIALTKILVKA